jgi:hypothetical protein
MPTHLTADHVASDAFPATSPIHGDSLPGHMGKARPGHSAAASTHFSGLMGMPAGHAPFAGPMETPGTVGPMPTNAPGVGHGNEGTDWFDAGSGALWDIPMQASHDLSVRPWQTRPAPPDSTGVEDVEAAPAFGEPVVPITPAIDIPAWPVVDSPYATPPPGSDGLIVVGGVAVTTLLLLAAGGIDHWNMQVAARTSRDDGPRRASRYFRGSPMLDGPPSPRPEFEQAPGHVAAHSL